MCSGHRLRLQFSFTTPKYIHNTKSRITAKSDPIPYPSTSRTRPSESPTLPRIRRSLDPHNSPGIGSRNICTYHTRRISSAHQVTFFISTTPAEYCNLYPLFFPALGTSHIPTTIRAYCWLVKILSAIHYRSSLILV